MGGFHFERESERYIIYRERKRETDRHIEPFFSPGQHSILRERNRERETEKGRERERLID